MLPTVFVGGENVDKISSASVTVTLLGSVKQHKIKRNKNQDYSMYNIIFLIYFNLLTVLNSGSVNVDTVHGISYRSYTICLVLLFIKRSFVRNYVMIKTRTFAFKYVPGNNNAVFFPLINIVFVIIYHLLCTVTST